MAKTQIDYNIELVARLIREMDQLMATKPILDPQSADFIVRNLVAGLKIALNRVKFLNDQMDMEFRSRISNGSPGSSAIH